MSAFDCIFMNYVQCFLNQLSNFWICLFTFLWYAAMQYDSFLQNRLNKAAVFSSQFHNNCILFRFLRVFWRLRGLSTNHVRANGERGTSVIYAPYIKNIFWMKKVYTVRRWVERSEKISNLIKVETFVDIVGSKKNKWNRNHYESIFILKNYGSAKRHTRLSPLNKEELVKILIFALRCC